MKNTKAWLIVMVMLFALILVGCDEHENIENPTGSQTEETSKTSEEANSEKAQEPVAEEIEEEDSNEQHPRVVITMENGGEIILRLYPEIAPETVKNFIELANKGFYNGVIFHRTIPGFMAQGGSPDGYGAGGPGYSIKGEFSSNGIENSLSHKRGIISMARTEVKDSAGSQFFIVVDDSASFSLDGNYAAFGKVVKGMKVVDEIVNSEVIRRDNEYSEDLIRRYNAFPNNEPDEEWIQDYIKEQREFNRPINPPVIKSITVDTFGIEYESPAKLEEQ